VKYIILFYTFSLFAFAQIPDVISIQWLQQHYNDPHLVLIDVRDKKEFQKSHLKRAISVPVFEKLFYGKQMLMPPLSKLKELFSHCGIDEKSKIIVYGGVNPIWSARFYWLSKVLGANNVGILQVSFGNWGKSSLPIGTKIYKPPYRDFVPKINNTILNTKLDVLTSMKKAYIIDGRPFEYYIGKKTHALRAGHIPTALNFPGNLTYDKIGNKSIIKSFETLKKVYKGLSKEKPIILYCEDGADAAMNFLVLKKLGYKVSVYEGSWLEWGNDLHLPIEKKVNKLNE